MLSFKEQLALVDQGLATVKVDGYLSTFKYHRKVMYDYLWKKHPKLLECRGHVYDNRNGKLVQAAPTKTFNYLEDGHWSDRPLDTRVSLYRKINGYMACATIYEGELVVSTTGTTNSEYAKWARDAISSWYFYDGIDECDTELFEVVVPQDPHIVQEQLGLHWLGFRDKTSGTFVPSHNTFVGSMTLAEALKLAETDRGEGFMMYTSNRSCSKLKTPYYVGKKKLMRMSNSNVKLMYKHPEFISGQIPKMWDHVIQRLIKEVNREDWLTTTEQTRRSYLEVFYGDH